MADEPKDEGVVSYDNIVKAESTDVDNPPSNLLKTEEPKPAEPVPVVAAPVAGTPAEPVAEDGAPAPEGDAAPVEGEPTAPKERVAKGVQKRLDTVTRNWREEERQRKALEAELAAFRALAPKSEGEGQEPAAPKPGVAPTKEQLEALIQQETDRRVAAAKYADGLKSIETKGKEAFADFDDRCNFLASLGAGDRPEFMQAVTAMENGHTVLAQLADKPDEATRILSLPPIPMAIELAKLGVVQPVAPKTRPVSNAPRPITPIDATAKGNSEPSDKDDESTWYAKRLAQKAQQAGKFARH